MELFDKMQQQGPVPDVITCSALISACEKGSLPERAMELFEALQQQGLAPDCASFGALVQGFGAAALNMAGFALLARVEVTELPSHDGNECYMMCRTLQEACRRAVDSDGAARVEAAVQRLSLSSLAPLAMAFVQ